MDNVQRDNVQEIEPKQASVPWTGFDVLLFFALWLAPLITGIVTVSLNQPQVETLAVEKQHLGHPIAQLVEQSQKSPMVLLVAFLVVVVVAPIIEEFLFRMLFQGWLETKFKQFQMPCASGVAVVITSFFFAAIHGNHHGAIDVPALLNGLVVMMVFSLTVFTAGLMYLSQIRNVRIADYLFVKERLVRTGFFTCVGSCLLVIVLCLALNVALTQNFPGMNLAPIAIFFFSLALGILYSKTQNLADCVLFHACLNGISLTILWISLS